MFGHLVKIPAGSHPGEEFWARTSGRRSRGRPSTRRRDYISRLAWEHLGVSLEELVEVAGAEERLDLPAKSVDPRGYAVENETKTKPIALVFRSTLLFLSCVDMIKDCNQVI